MSVGLNNDTLTPMHLIWKKKKKKEKQDRFCFSTSSFRDFQMKRH